MDSRIIILFLLIALALYYYIDKYINIGSSKLTPKEEAVIEDPPPDWTLDWGGGHGRDRFDIMTEPGPYILPFDNQLVPLP